MANILELILTICASQISAYVFDGCVKILSIVSAYGWVLDYQLLLNHLKILVVDCFCNSSR